MNTLTDSHSVRLLHKSFYKVVLTGIHHFMGCHPFLGKFTILGQWLNLLPRNLLQVDLAYLSYVQLKSQGLRACRSMTRH